MCEHSQRSRNICTGVMKPCRRPSAQMRVPATSRNNGVISPAAVAISPKVTMPLAKAWPDEPSTANAVMCVPKSEVRKTYGSHRAAREEVLLGAFVRAAMAEREDADVQHHREVSKDDDNREHDEVSRDRDARARWRA